MVIKDLFKGFRVVCVGSKWGFILDKAIFSRNYLRQTWTLE